MSVVTIVRGDFEWDHEKAAANVENHGVSFDEAITAFADPAHAVFDDGSGEDRHVLIGFSHGGRLLTVVHVERGQRERIISAWRATKTEESKYREG